MNGDGLSDREIRFFTQSARQTVRVHRPLMKGKIDTCLSKGYQSYSNCTIILGLGGKFVIAMG